MAEIPVFKSSGNVYRDIGFTPAEAAELTAKSTLISAIGETIKRRKLTQQEAARRCGTDQPTLSKVLRGRMESVTIDRLTAWLTALGRTVEIRVRPFNAKAKKAISSPRHEGFCRFVGSIRHRTVSAGSIVTRGDLSDRYFGAVEFGEAEAGVVLVV